MGTIQFVKNEETSHPRESDVRLMLYYEHLAGGQKGDQQELFTKHIITR